jgi:hypothetical protein
MTVEGPALTDLLGGQMQVYFPPLTTSIEYESPTKYSTISFGHHDR